MSCDGTNLSKNDDEVTRYTGSGERLAPSQPTKISLCLLQAVNPLGEGSATQVLLLQSSQSSTSTGVRFRLMRSCHEMVFIHLFLCLPRYRRPYTSASRMRLTQWSSSHRWTCPYHLSLDSRILSVMQETPAAWQMSSFLFLSFSVIPSSHRSILISVLSTFKKPCFCSINHHWPFCFIDLPFDCNRHPLVTQHS